VITAYDLSPKQRRTYFRRRFLEDQ
jgi:hypothetical protein